MSAAGATRRRRRRRWFVALALLLGLVLGALALELVVRSVWPLPAVFAEFEQAGMYAATADGDVVLQPGYRGVLQIEVGHITQVAVNSLGMRGDEPPPRGAGKRVLVLGDSLVFGYGVEHDHALPARLQAALGARGIDAVVGNAGVPTYGSRHSVAQLARLDPVFSPDAIVLCYYLGNDATDDLLPRRVVYAGLQFHGPMATLVRTSWRVRLAIRSRAALWVESWIFRNKPSWSPLLHAAYDPEELAGMNGLPGDPPDFRAARGGLFLDVVDEQTSWDAGAPAVLPRVLAALEQSLQRAVRLARGRPLWLLVLPNLHQVDAEVWREGLARCAFDAALYRRGLAQQRVLAVAKKCGVAALDATAVLAASADPAADFIADRGHLSEVGNERLALWLAEAIAGKLR